MPLPSRKELVVYAVLALVAVVLGVRWVQAQAAADEPAAGPAERPAATVEAPREADEVLVHVAGAVREPGVYRVPRGARVRDALRAAGGATGGADVHAINLAARVEDAQQVVVPRRAAAAGAGGPAAGSGGSGGSAAAGPAGAAASAPAASGAAPGSTAAPPVSLSTATVEQLDALDGVGPALAQRIVDHRAQRGGFSSVDDLAEVPGIGPKRLEALRAAVVP